jgi:hypothetical protein
LPGNQTQQQTDPRQEKPNGIARVASALVSFGSEFTIDHHGQLGAFGLMIGGAVFLRSPLMGLAVLGYAVMHFSYGGSGTFQRPIRLGASYGIVDIGIVILGVISLMTYVITACYHVVSWALTIGWPH